MPPRKTPTERQKRLGIELRKMRTAAGVSTDYAAQLIGVDRMKISNMEAGIRVIAPERVRTLMCNYDCTDAEYIEALAAMAGTNRKRSQGWWERYRGSLPPGLLDIAELEWHAKRLHTVQTVHIPGLLQTEDYARAIFRSVLPSLPPLEIELRVAHRLDRQRVFDRVDPVEYVGYIHEAALRMQFGGRAVVRDQLVHVLAASERDHITLRVIPVETGAFPGAGHALLYAEGPVSQLDTVQLDSAHGPDFRHADPQLAKYRLHLEWMDNEALPEGRSRDFIREITDEL